MKTINKNIFKNQDDYKKKLQYILKYAKVTKDKNEACPNFVIALTQDIELDKK